MNFKIEQIEAAEVQIKALRASEDAFRLEANKDGVIDDAEQAVLDRIKGKITQLQTAVQKIRVTIEENKRIWESKAASYEAWQDQIGKLTDWGHIDHAAFDKTATDLKEAVADQRWADATAAFDQSVQAMTPVFETYQTQSAAKLEYETQLQSLQAKISALGSAPAQSDEAKAQEAQMAALQTEMEAALATGDAVTAKAKLAEFEGVLESLATAKAAVAANVAEPAMAGGDGADPADQAPAQAAPGEAPTDSEAPGGAAPAAADDEAKWKAAFDAFKARLATLEKHAQAGAVPEIKPHVDAIKTARDAAVAKATANDFKEALKLLSPLPKKCDEVISKANGFAHYAAILAHRQSLVTPLAGAVDPIPDADKVRLQIIDLMTKAQADAAAGKFDDGVKKLDQIVPLHEKMKVTSVKGQAYQTLIANHDPRVAALVALPANIKAPLKPAIDAFKKLYGSGKFAKTKDYIASMQILEPMWRDLGYIERSVTSAQGYQAKLGPFETQFKAFEAHKGREGIEAFFLGMKNDYEMAKTAAAEGKHSTAIPLLDRTQPNWVAQTQIADDCLAYITKRDAVTKVIDAVRTNPAAASVLQQADALMATAATQALSKAFPTALATVTEAETRANDAKAAAAAQDALGKLKDDGKLGAIDKDFAAAYKVFTDMKAEVVSKDAGSKFTALIATADVPAQKAQDENAKPAPDFGVARGHLDAAIAILEGALPKILADAGFQTHLAAAKTLVDTTLPPLSIDDCIKPAITSAKALVTEAEALAKPNGYDFPGAEAKLAEATKIGTAAQADAGLWAGIKTDRATTKTAADAIAAEPTVVASMAARTKVLTDIMAEVDKLVAVPDFKAAAAKAKEGAALLVPTRDDIKNCKDSLKYKKDTIDVKLKTIEGVGKEAAADHVAKANAKIAEFQTLMNDGNFKGAQLTIYEANWAIDAGTKALAAAASYEPKRVVADTKLKSAAAVRNAGIEAKLVALEARYKVAVAEAAKGNYFGAEPEMVAIAAECDPLIVQAGQFAGYENARKIAEPKLLKAEGHPQAEAIKTMLVRLRAKYDKAVALATEGDQAAAQVMMEEVGPAADEAVNSADQSAIFDGIADAIAGSSPNSGPTFIHIAAARKAYDWQAGKANAAVAKPELDDAKAQIDKAENSATPPKDANAALQAGIDKVKRAGELLSQHQLLKESIDAAKAKIAELKAHPQKDYIASAIADLETKVAAVVTLSADGTKLDKAATDLEAAMTGYHDAKAKADAHVKYLALRAEPEVEPRLDVLERHAHSYAIQPNIETIRKKLADAAAKSTAMDPDAAIALLEEAKALGVSSFVLAEMRANTPPNVADVKAILARPGGEAELDAMLDVLEPDARRAVLRVAFEARFGCDLKNFTNAAKNADGTYKNLIPDGALEAPNIKRFYEIMSELPKEHTTDNDSMRSFSVIESGDGSLYQTDPKNIVMREGDEDVGKSYAFGDPFQVGDVEKDCEPANDEPVKKFSWNTLHEVGHSVDDKHGFMNKNQSGDAYGGWTAYGRNVKPIADIVAQKFKYDAGYVSQVLSRTTNPAVPARPAAEACSDEEWESRRLTVDAWYASVATKAKPWTSNSVAQSIAIGGVVYQESYDFDWYSYKFAARSQGITGYQFRAPGEWFSELYAAYHSDKLKGEHPAVKWLAGL
ncbi:MAG: hypothetical protein WBN04_19650 [Paracoccaceae bacterium]